MDFGTAFFGWRRAAGSVSEVVSKFDMATAGNYARIYGSGHSPLPQTRTSIPAIAMLIRTLSDLQNLCTCALSGMMNIRERRDIRSN